MSEFESQYQFFRRKFKKAYRHMDQLESKIDQKEGLIFKNHIYSKEDLLNSEHHKAIFSITGKIGDDARNWHLRGKLTEEGKVAYHDNREEVDDKLHHINTEISNRQPTWWEGMKGALEGYVDWVMENLPALKGLFLAAGKVMSKIPYVGKPLGLLIRGSVTGVKLLQRARKIRQIEKEG